VALPRWFHDLAASVRNWGRWGDDDEVGTVNLLTAEARRRGAASVATGRVFSLALPLSESEGIQLGFIPGRINPVRTMTQVNQPLGDDPEGVCTSDDLVVMGLQAATHWDGLAHVSYGGRIWNGHPASSVTAVGAGRCGIHRIRTLTGRGVLLDVARARGVDRLAGGHAITGDDLDAAAELARVAVEPGDVVLVRTGQMALLRSGDRMGYAAPSPGLSTKSVRWLRDHDVAAVATDTMVFEVWPAEDPAVLLPVHLLHLVDMGLTQGQNFVLDDLAADCADDGRYAFLLEASPLPFTGAVGAPVAPVAIK
jgi:kynurenine formamidase